jgi:hypothetical protein
VSAFISADVPNRKKSAETTGDGSLAEFALIECRPKRAGVTDGDVVELHASRAGI